jgi:hypothetical protein
MAIRKAPDYNGNNLKFIADLPRYGRQTVVVAAFLVGRE